MAFPSGLRSDLVSQVHFFQTAQFPAPCLLQEANHHHLPYVSCWVALQMNGIERLNREVNTISLPTQISLSSITNVESANSKHE